jgi:hypothetical protein
MIYREGVRLEKSDLLDKVEILKEVFPTYFRKENPLPIVIDYIQSAKFQVTAFTPGGDNVVGTIWKSPQPMGISNIGYEEEDGFRSEIRYTDRSPIITGSGLDWPRFQMDLSSKMKLEPGVDLEKLIFLYFYCSHFTNNQCPNKRKSARFEFIIPEKQIESKYDNIAARRKLEDEILIEETRMSYEMVKSIMNTIGLNIRGEEKVDRVQLFDVVLSSKSMYSKYITLKGNIIPEKKSTVSEVVELTQVKNIVANLVDNLKIFDDEKGAWRIKGPGKPKFLCDIEGETPEEKLFNLVEFVSSNQEVLQSVKSLVK